MKRISRRSLLAGSLALGLVPRRVRSAIATANNEIRVAVLGLRSRGNTLVQDFAQVPGVRVVALCDPDQEILANRVGAITSKANTVKSYGDPRMVMDDDNIDVVAIATPNHWHTLLGIWACQAGKDVYVEKPVSHNLFEGWQLVEAARQHNCIAQTGTQNRSDVGLRKAANWIHADNLGPIKVVRGFCYNPRPSIGKVSAPQTVPSYIDYNTWSGPAPLKPVQRGQFHYDWHWDYTYGNGDVGNQGVHELDICRWMLGAHALPESVTSIGGRFGYDDDGNTPNTLVSVLNYEPAPIVFEVRGLPSHKGAKGMDSYRGQSVGLVVECEGGYFAGGRGGGAMFDSSGRLIVRFPGDSGATHVANFIDAVRSRDATTLRAEIVEGMISSGLSHFCNLSYQVGTPTLAAEIEEQMPSDSHIANAFGGMAKHLAANEVDLEKVPVTLGPMLQWNASAKSFVGNEAANQRITSEYREPFVVPNLTT